MFGNPYTLFVLELCKHCREPSPSSSQVGTHPMMGQLLVFARHLNFDKEMSWDIFLLYIASSDWQHLTEKALCSGSYFCWRNYSLQLKPCKCHWLSVSWNAKLRGLRCLTNLRLCTGKFPFSVHSFFHLQSVSQSAFGGQPGIQCQYSFEANVTNEGKVFLATLPPALRLLRGKNPLGVGRRF